MNRPDRLVVALVLAHFAVVLAHSGAHVGLGILPGPLDAAFILIVIAAGPVVGIAVLPVRTILGTTLLFVLMVASFGYGFVSHFLIAGPDRVAVVPPEPWTVMFVATAAALGVLETAGAVAGLVAFRAARTPSAPAAPRA